MSTTIPTITCPLDCLASFSEVQEYDHPLIDELLRRNAVYNPLILDIGANVGAFTIWARERFHRSAFVCYEPNPKIYSTLIKNILHSQKKDIFQALNCAVGNPEFKLLLPRRNRLCSTLLFDPRIDDPLEEGIKVKVLSPEELPPSNIIKIDTEGSEGYICEHLKHIPEYLVLEYHSDELMIQCLNAMKGKMTLIGVTITQPGLGILKWGRL